MNCRRLMTTAAMTAVVAAGSVAGSGIAAAGPLGFSDTGSAGLDGSLGGWFPHGLVLNVTNSSSHALQWVGGTDPDNTPAAVIPPYGTDRIVWKGGNLEVMPTWQVQGTEYNLFPSIGVPYAGGNGIICDVDQRSADSPVGYGHCDIGSGWDPDAHVTFIDIP